MRDHDYNPDHSGAGPKSDHVERADPGRVYRAAGAGRLRAVGVSGLLSLQRTIGNAAVTHLLQRARAVEAEAVHEELPRSPVLDVVGKGGGRPMDGALRVEMEARLGDSFGDVRIHTDSKAKASAKAVQAKAYTVGNEIVFGDGVYNPGSAAGKHTVAHELTHVQQQRSGPVAGTSTGDGVAISDPVDSFEQAAEANAVKVMSGDAPATPPSVGAGIAAARSAVQRSTGEEVDTEDEQPLQRCPHPADEQALQRCPDQPHAQEVRVQRCPHPEDEQAIQRCPDEAPAEERVRVQRESANVSLYHTPGCGQPGALPCDPGHLEQQAENARPIVEFASRPIEAMAENIGCAVEGTPDPGTDPHLKVEWSESEKDWMVGGRLLREAPSGPSWSLADAESWPVTQVGSAAVGNWIYPGFPTPCYRTDVGYSDWSDRKSFVVSVRRFSTGESSAKAGAGIFEGLSVFTPTGGAGRGLAASAAKGGSKAAGEAVAGVKAAGRSATTATENAATRATGGGKAAGRAGQGDRIISDPAPDLQLGDAGNILDRLPKAEQEGLKTQARQIMQHHDRFTLSQGHAGSEMAATVNDHLIRIAAELKQKGRDAAVAFAKRLNQERGGTNPGALHGGAPVKDAADVKSGPAQTGNAEEHRSSGTGQQAGPIEHAGPSAASAGKGAAPDASTRWSNYLTDMKTGEQEISKVTGGSPVMKAFGDNAELEHFYDLEETTAGYRRPATPDEKGVGAHFENSYGKTKDGKGIAVMMENYRYSSPNKWFASEAFMNEWATANRLFKEPGVGNLSRSQLAKKGRELLRAPKGPQDLPDELPSTIYRRNIDNPDTKKTLGELLGQQTRLDFREGDAAYLKVMTSTVNGKTTGNIVTTFNSLKGLPEEGARGFHISSGSIVKDGTNLHLRFNIERRTGL
ncbi:uncharacterized protein DUF4157 [Streptomyces sp. SLBN-118]|uniref:eCIS core domain-containing protein n=1 Tax=Streptomyces sp. SLBN-118 TaxID=2768454 RepID=UPI00115083A8|nr:DUF4157 domain-containing protein [Streptomyces sp. SLBN-118]TQK44152.1 uncharacterized protein DUF4157 [Streptomyces sp. SLBN-118]